MPRLAGGVLQHFSNLLQLGKYPKKKKGVVNKRRIVGPMKRLKKAFVLSHEWNIFLVLLIIISLSLFCWWTVKVHLEKEWSARLQAEVEIVTAKINRELYGYEDALTNIKAFYLLKGMPTPKEFQLYSESSQLQKRFAGLQGIAFARLTKDKEQLEKELHANGYPEFKVWPEESVPPYIVISMIQPEDWRNKKALGFNMYSEAIRRTAIDKAIHDNKVSITDPVDLVQSGEEEHNKGFLIYLPVPKAVTTDPEIKLDNIDGVIYAIIRLPLFFNGALGTPEFYTEKVSYTVQTYDASSKRALTIYDRFPEKERPRFISDVYIERDIPVFDKTWKIRFEPLPHFFSWYERYIPIIFAIVTLILLSIVFWALWSTQQYLRLSERHQEALSEASKNKTTEIILFRKLNSILADMTSTIESHALFERFIYHLKDVFEIEEAVVYSRESGHTYEREFQSAGADWEDSIKVPEDFDSLQINGIIKLSPEIEVARQALELLPEHIRNKILGHCYYLLRTNLRESGKSTSILILVKGPMELCESNIREYALQSIFAQFAVSYDKALLLKRAEDANLMKSSFLANMSHEIRTPLGVIVGFSEILAQDEVDAEEKDNIVSGLKRNGKALARLIDDILDISKVEAGKLQLEMGQVNLDSLIQEVKSIMDVRASEKQLQFNVARLGNVPSHIVTDDIRLKQILLNIVGNALKFTEQGSVKILYRTVTGTENQDFLEFQIQDTGIGISEKHREGLFDAFSQGDVTTTRKYGGTGLGLALSHRLAELLGGELFLLESSVGKGSVFCLRIPLQRSTPNYSVGGPRRVTLDISRDEGSRENIDWRSLNYKTLLNGVNVLLVEDSLDNQEIFEHFLTSAGADVTLAEDGEKAIELALATNPDIVLMDIQIPKIDGKQATRTLREKGFKKPIVALTAHALNEEISSCLKAGCNGQITKPVSGELLLQEVYFYLNLKEA